MKRGEKIKAVVFDVGGVLEINSDAFKRRVGGHVNLGIHEEIAKDLNISIDQYFDSIDTTYAFAVEGKISRENTLKTLSRNLKTSPKKLNALYLNAYRKNFTQNKQLFNLIFKLKKRGCKIAVLSDQWYLSREAIMPRKIYDKFNLVLVSCEQKMRKPNPAFYKLLIKKLNLKPSQILFIDNQMWNIKPAKVLGVKTILFKDNRTLFNNKIWRNLFL